MGTPTTMAEADQLREWAFSTAGGDAAPATRDQLARHLDFMRAALPSRGDDDRTGKMRFAVYAALLGDRSEAALAFMARTACATLEWFPSPSQCLDILNRYQPPASEQAEALIEVKRFTDAQFPLWLASVREGGPVGDVPEKWMRIAVEDGAMRLLSDGTMVSRALYYGPPRPPYREPIKTVTSVAPNAPPTRAAGMTAGLI